MLHKVINFIKYNNAFPILFSIIFLSTSISFAANEDLRNSVIDSQEVVRSIDNSFVVSANLDSFDFNLQILDVIEDENNYYVTYSYQTIALDDYVWKIMEVKKSLDVSKVALESSYLKDLGLYVAKNLSDNINSELYYLKRVQNIEIAKGLSQKVVAVEYSGLIGKRLRSREKVFEDYSAVIPQESKEEIARKMSPEEISATTRTVMAERKRREQEEQILAEKEALLLAETASTTPTDIATTTDENNGSGSAGTTPPEPTSIIIPDIVPEPTATTTPVVPEPVATTTPEVVSEPPVVVTPPEVPVETIPEVVPEPITATDPIVPPSPSEVVPEEGA